mmetsp:Transcript_21846/g.26759  ORF Transcript_21846/g.26759 Transcript_21846/m.26759 type:complete len:618 (+) Transcript_21846:1157-3010(+)
MKETIASPRRSRRERPWSIMYILVIAAMILSFLFILITHANVAGTGNYDTENVLDNLNQSLRSDIVNTNGSLTDNEYATDIEMAKKIAMDVEEGLEKEEKSEEELSKVNNKETGKSEDKKENVVKAKDAAEKLETAQVRKDQLKEEKDKMKAESKKANESDDRMNILILYPDDWRHDSIGSEKPYVLTPFLDQLAKEGIRFTQNAVTTSICWMSRATLWMGQYSSRHRSYRLKCPNFATPSNWEHSWVKILQKAGYFIGHVGKWQYHTEKTERFFDWAKLFEGQHWVKRFPGRTVHASDLAAEDAETFLRNRPKDKPFVLSVAFYPPKAVGTSRGPGGQWSPTNETRALYDNVTIPEPEMKESFKLLPKFLQEERGPARGRWRQRYPTSENFQASMKNYYALVTGVDQACKRIVDKLKEEGLYNNTMIIFTTDNGMFHGAHGLAGKWYPYQESIRVPLIIYDPRMPSDKVGTLDDSFTLNVDLAQTILGAAGVRRDELMQGRDISDLYLPNEKNENEPWRDEFFYEFPYGKEQSCPSSTALVRKDWKYIYWPYYKREQLFNLVDDPMELNDLNSDNVLNYTNEKMLDIMSKRHDELKALLHNPNYSGINWDNCSALA